MTFEFILICVMMPIFVVSPQISMDIESISDIMCQPGTDHEDLQAQVIKLLNETYGLNIDFTFSDEQKQMYHFINYRNLLQTSGCHNEYTDVCTHETKNATSAPMPDYELDVDDSTVGYFEL